MSGEDFHLSVRADSQAHVDLLRRWKQFRKATLSTYIFASEKLCQKNNKLLSCFTEVYKVFLCGSFCFRISFHKLNVDPKIRLEIYVACE